MDLLAVSMKTAALLVVASSVAFSVVAVILVRRWDLHHKLEKNNEFVGLNYPTVGLIYGVFLAFVIVIAWGHYADAEQAATIEVTFLNELWRDAQAFPENERVDIQNRLHRYASDVVAFEWPTMAESGIASDEAERSYEEIWRFYYELEPAGEVEQAFFAVSLEQLNEMGRYRMQRILDSRAYVHPLMWIFLLGGAAVTIVFALLSATRHAWVQIVVLSSLTALICYSIVMVYALERPFTGEVSIKPYAFRELIEAFEHMDPELRQP